MFLSVTSSTPSLTCSVTDTCGLLVLIFKIDRNLGSCPFRAMANINLNLNALIFILVKSNLEPVKNVAFIALIIIIPIRNGTDRAIARPNTSFVNVLINKYKGIGLFVCFIFDYCKPGQLQWMRAFHLHQVQIYRQR